MTKADRDMSEWAKNPAYQRTVLNAKGAYTPPKNIIPPPPPKEPRNEHELEKQCGNYLNQHDIASLHMSYRAREKNGWPDRVFVINGEPIAVELKSKTGKLTDDQKAVLAQMDRNGWHVYVVRYFETFIGIVRWHLGISEEGGHLMREARWHPSLDFQKPI